MPITRNSIYVFATCLFLSSLFLLYKPISHISLNIYVQNIKLNLDLRQNELLDNFVGYEFPGNICAFYIMLANCRFTLEGKQFRLGHYWTVMVIIEMIWYPAWTTNGEKICCNIHSRFALLLRILQSFNLGNKNVHYAFTWAHIKLLSLPNVSEILLRNQTSWFIVWYYSFSTKRKSIITFGRYNRTIQFLPSLIPKRIFHLTLRMIFAIKVRKKYMLLYTKKLLWCSNLDFYTLGKM